MTILPGFPAERFAQSSGREQGVITQQPVGQSGYVQPALRAMLEGIVQHDGIHSGIFQFQQLLNAVTTVFIYRYPCIGNLF